MRPGPVIFFCKLLARLPGGHGKDPVDLGRQRLRDSPEKSVHPTDLAMVGGYPRPLASGKNVARHCDTRGQRVYMWVCRPGLAPVSREIV